MLYKLELINDHISIPFIGKPNISNYFHLVKMLNNERNKYQLSICLRHSLRKLPSKIFDYLIFKYFLNVKVGIGFWNSSELSCFPLSGEDTYPMIQEYKRLINVLCSEGLNIDQNNLRYKILDLIKEKIKGVKISFDKLLMDNAIILCPFSREKEKKWNYENYIYLSRKLLQLRKKIIIIGSDEEYKDAELMKNEIGSEVVNLCGKLNIIELSKLFENSKMYIGNDTGPMHISGLLNIPTFALFSRHSNPGKFSPMGDSNIIFRPKKSINDIDPDEVFREVIKIIG